MDQDLNTYIEKILAKKMSKVDGLMNGNLGKVLLSLISYKVYGNRKFFNKGITTLSSILNRLEKGNSTLNDPSLSEGMIGLGLLLNHIEHHNLAEDAIDFDILDEIDQYATEWFGRFVDSKNFSYLIGAAGCLFYLVKRN